MRKLIIFSIVLLAIAGGLYGFRNEIKNYFDPPETSSGLILYGNVDHRQLRLSFQLPERIKSLLPEEGSLVHKGDLLGTLDDTRIQQNLDLSQSRVEVCKAAILVAEQSYLRAKNGSRKEDISMACSANAAVQARLRASQLEFNRKKELVENGAVAKQEKDSAEADYLFYKALLEGVKSYQERLDVGERVEDVLAAKEKVKQAKAELVCSEKAVVVHRQQLKDAKLYAPCDGIIRNRLQEPGEMTSPQTPVLTLSKISPKWIRCYLTEKDLTRVKAGDLFDVQFDGAERPFEGWVGFISQNAEFTPKNIETPELRSSLVYEMRVFVKDPENRLKLGAPCTLVLKNP